MYSAMTADLPSIQSQSAYSPDSSKDPMVKALPMFVHSFAGVSGTPCILLILHCVAAEVLWFASYHSIDDNTCICVQQ